MQLYWLGVEPQCDPRMSKQISDSILSTLHIQKNMGFAGMTTQAEHRCISFNLYFTPALEGVMAPSTCQAGKIFKADGKQRINPPSLAKSQIVSLLKGLQVYSSTAQGRRGSKHVSPWLPQCSTAVRSASITMLCNRGSGHVGSKGTNAALQKSGALESMSRSACKHSCLSLLQSEMQTRPICH